MKKSSQHIAGYFDRRSRRCFANGGGGGHQDAGRGLQARRHCARGLFAYDSSANGKRPGVLLLPRYHGMSDFTRQHTEMVAKLGYVVFAPDIYGKTVRPKAIPEFVEQSKIYNADRPLMRARAQAGFDMPAAEPDGRCRQVGHDRLLLRRQPSRSSSRERAYPSSARLRSTARSATMSPEAHKNIKGRFLILHGAEDPIAPLDEVNKLDQGFPRGQGGLADGVVQRLRAWLLGAEECGLEQRANAALLRPPRCDSSAKYSATEPVRPRRRLHAVSPPRCLTLP